MAIVTVSVLAGIEESVANIANVVIAISDGIAIIVAVPATHLAEAASAVAETAVLVLPSVQLAPAKVHRRPILRPLWTIQSARLPSIHVQASSLPGGTSQLA